MRIGGVRHPVLAVEVIAWPSRGPVSTTPGATVRGSDMMPGCATTRLVLLGILISDAERLRARGLALMQGEPDAPVQEDDRRASADLLVRLAREESPR